MLLIYTPVLIKYHVSVFMKFSTPSRCLTVAYDLHLSYLGQQSAMVMGREGAGGKKTRPV